MDWNPPGAGSKGMNVCSFAKDYSGSDEGMEVHLLRPPEQINLSHRWGNWEDPTPTSRNNWQKSNPKQRHMKTSGRARNPGRRLPIGTILSFDNTYSWALLHTQYGERGVNKHFSRTLFGGAVSSYMFIEPEMSLKSLLVGEIGGAYAMAPAGRRLGMLGSKPLLS